MELSDFNDATISLPLNEIIEHSFSVGEHNVSITCNNTFSNENASIDLIVVVPIDSIDTLSSCSPCLSGNITINVTLNTGSFVTVDIFYKNTSCCKVMPLHANSLNGYMWSCSCEVPGPSLVTQGETIIFTAIATNPISNYTTETPVQVFQQIDNVTMTIKTNHSSQASPIVGFGPNNDIHPADSPVVFISSYTNGPPLTFDWQITCDITTTAVTVVETFEHQFPVKSQDCLIILTMATDAQEVSVNTTISLVLGFIFESVTTDSPVIIGNTMRITVNLGSFGEMSCMWLDPGDNLTLYFSKIYTIRALMRIMLRRSTRPLLILRSLQSLMRTRKK